ncbi:putative mitochondrial dicarboxylate carrier protein [Gonapodya prolifera JEL478]|uniref:Putative mitochondrial dicarboxylate carrier protein n=1 Tax=Gonapodya prolifera (strain JEL478) TaxID=1344416 RepID=A0A139A203_GONPJ|nr:putative mitochondrial dicarboxylate carrier protein [Gonapodya prolifera JEL478]|eukprot:KXS10816.1 putative mitochondrial dicarboxylate carrier protein [Gonapodya prolifera JEL478]
MSDFWFTVKPYVLGGAAGCFSTTIIQPIDMVKVRIQLAGEGKASGASSNPFTLFSKIVKEEGPLALYQGLGAAYLRQLTYTTARMGIFTSTLDALKGWREKQGRTLTFGDRAGAGLVAGALGSLVGVPADLSLVRMQADTTLPPELRRNYTGVFNALARTVREEGMRGLFTGSTPTVVRAMALNVGQLTGNAEALSRLEAKFGKGSSTAVYGAAVISGFLASVMSLPLDFIKTRLQKQKADPITGEVKYKGVIDCASKVLKEEGFVFYRGFGTYFMRIAPHVTMTMIVLDWMNRTVKSYGL